MNQSRLAQTNDELLKSPIVGIVTHRRVDVHGVQAFGIANRHVPRFPGESNGSVHLKDFIGAVIGEITTIPQLTDSGPLYRCLVYAAKRVLFFRNMRLMATQPVRR